MSPYAPHRKRIEIDYNSEDDYRYGCLYKRDQGESNAYHMPEEPLDVVFPGTEPKTKARRVEEEDESDNEEEYPNERPSRRERREAREELVMQNADELSERQYKNFLVNLDYEKMNNVINGIAFHTMEKSQSVRSSNRYINDQ